MTVKDAADLSRHINVWSERGGRFVAAPFAFGDAALVVLRDRRLKKPSPLAIVDAHHYLRLIRERSIAAEDSRELRDTLEAWVKGARARDRGWPVG